MNKVIDTFYSDEKAHFLFRILVSAEYSLNSNLYYGLCASVSPHTGM